MKENAHAKMFWYALSDLLVGNIPNARRCSRFFKPAFFLLIVFSLLTTALQAQWVQTGLDIDGETGGDNSGFSVSLSSDGSTVAIGAPYNNNFKGQVRVYKWVSGVWIQQGNDIDGEAEYDMSGYSVSLSSDGSTVAIGAPSNNNGKGHVRVYKWVSGAWIQQGNDIDGEAEVDQSGWSVSLSSNGSTVAIGAPNNNNGKGHVRVYKLMISGAWTQLGNDIDGEAGGDNSGFSVSLSSDGSTVAIGAPNNNNYKGHVRVYKLISGTWTQQGADIDGEAAVDQSGWSVSLSSDGSTVAIGAPNNNNGKGHVRVYKLISGAWTQQGNDIDGEAAGDQSGYSVSLSSDGSTVAIGAPYNNNDKGHVRVYKLISGAWTQQGNDIDGEAAGYQSGFGRVPGDQSGWAVSLSSDGGTVAIGAPYNDGSGNDAGHVRVYMYPLIPCTTPTAYSVSGSGIICPSASANISLSGSQSGHTYQLQRNGANTGSPVNGTGGTLPFPTTQTGTYTVVATSPAGGTCTALMSESAVLTADNAPPTITCADPVTINTTAGQCTGTTTLTAPTVTDNCNVLFLKNAINSDGMDDYMTAPFSGTGLTQLSVEFRFKKDNTTNSGIFQWAGSVTSNSPWILLRDFGSSVTLYVNGDNRITSAALSVNTWYHVAITYNGSTWRMYINGNLSGSYTGSIGSNVNTNVYFGNGYPTYWKGTIDEARIWNTARTQTQIQNNMTSELIGNEDNLVAYWRFNQGNAGGDNNGLTTATATVGPNGTLNNFTLDGPISNWVGVGLGDISNNAPATYPKGNTTVTWTATDASGNTNTCQQTVTVVAPPLTNPGNQAMNVIANTCAANYTIADPISDNCTGSTWGYTLMGATTVTVTGIPDGTSSDVLSFNKGTTTVVLSATDGTNSAATVSFTVTVTDNEPPTITCADPVTINTTAGLCTGTTTLTAPTITDNCSLDNALDFDIASPFDQVNCGNNTALQITNSITLEAWINADAWRNNASQGSIINKEQNDPDRGYMLRCGNNGTLEFYLGNDTWTGCNSTSGALTVGVWTHVAATYDGSMMRIYKNGVLLQSVARTDAIGNATRDLFIGSSQADPSRVFDGKIDAVRIWNVARSQAQIQSTMNAELTGPQGGLVASYNFNTGVAGENNAGITTATNDQGDAALNGTLSNFVLNGNNSNWVGSNSNVVASNNAPSTYPIGTTTVTWTATDASGNTQTCEQTVTVMDNQAPTFTCPSNTTVNTNGSANCAVLTPDLLADINDEADNCGTASLSQLPAADAPKTNIADGGSFTVTITANDGNGNTNAVPCVVTVTVNDDDAPTFTCPSNTTVNTNGSANCAVLTPDLLTGIINEADNCGTANLSQLPAADAPKTNIADGGSFTVTITANDGNGNTNAVPCVVTVTVNDDDAPTFTCPSNTTVNTNGSANCAVLTPDLLADINDEADNCGTASLSQLPAVDAPVTDIADGGTFSVTVTANDGNGNSNAVPCVVTVTVNDDDKPTISGCPGNKILKTSEDGGTDCEVTLTYTAPTFSDNCDGTGTATWVSGPTSGTSLSVSSTPYTVVYTKTDAAGNAVLTNCSFTVTVQDDTKPGISCPANQSVPTAPDNCSTPPVTYSVTTTDNCSSTVSLVSGSPSGSVFPLGVNTVVWKATDPGGNSTTCAFTVTVGDAQNPSIVCPPNISRNTDPSQCTAVATYATPTVSDNCTGWTLTRTGGLASGSAFPKGVNMVQWQVSDVGGNVAICQFTVTVTDNRPPVITCPANLVRSNDAGQCYAVVNYTAPTATDNCGTVTVARTSAANTASGSQFPKGVTTVTWEATDNASPANTAACSFTVTVNDTQLPTITCPANQTKPADAGLCTAVTNYTTPTFTDNCTGGSVAIQSGLASGSAFPKGINTVQWKATDGAGLTKTCTFRITVNDTQAPTISCPASQSLSTDAGLCSAVATYATPTASDNCTTPPTVVKTSGLASGSAFPKGTSTVVWKATDGGGLTNTCSFTVTVTDAQLPTITCPANISATGSGSPCLATVSYTSPTATDNCTVQSVFLLSGPGSGSQLPAGVTTVVWRAIDNSGGSSTCAFTVTVSCGATSEELAVRSEELAVSNGLLAVSSEHQLLVMNLVPNPATAEVQIAVENLGETGGDITVTDAQGRTVWQRRVGPEALKGGALTLNVSVEKFAAGLYFVTLRSDGKPVTKRLAVQRL